MIVAEADEMGGFSLWVDEHGLLHHSYSMMGVEQYQQVSTEPIPTGDVTVRMQFDADRQERSAGGNGLALRERRRRSARAGWTRPCCSASPATPAWTSAATTAWSSTAPTRTRLRTPFTGTVKKVVFDLKPAAGTRTRKPCTRPRPTARRHTASAPNAGEHLLCRQVTILTPRRTQ